MHPMRRLFVGAAATIGALALVRGLIAPSRLNLSAQAAARPKPPNVIVILADDLGYADVSANGLPWIPTPNIDALARRGVRFTDGYVTAAVCAPSRAGLLTGRHQARFGFESNPGRGGPIGPPPAEVMLPTVMKQAGYATGMIGKWHLGEATGYHPLDRGFDEYFGVLRGATAYLPELGPTDEAAVTGMDAVLTRERMPIYRDRQVVNPTGYLTDVFTREAVDFIHRHSKEPFFLYVAYTTPHVPLQANQKYLQRFRSIKDPYRRVYAAMVSALDDGVGDILKELERTGLRKDTVVIFLSDNGCASYVKGACSNEPLSGYKEYPWEGGIRVPYVVSWPKGLNPGVYRSPVSSLDIFPTAVALAGVQPPEALEGIDLLPYLQRNATPAPSRQLYWTFGPNHAIRDGRWKLLVVNKSGGGDEDAKVRRNGSPAGLNAEASPFGQYTLLYDLQADPEEKHDLAAQHPDVVRRLQSQFSAWNALNPQPAFTGIRKDGEVNGYKVQLFN